MNTEAAYARLFVPEVDIVRPHGFDKNLITSSWVTGWTNDPKWKNLGFIYDSKEIHDNMSRFPITANFLREMGKKCNIIMAGFSFLKPGGKIPWHTDSSVDDPSYVMHIPLIVPNEKGCYIELENGETYAYHKDTSPGDYVFPDFVRHRVFNNTREDRIILYLKIDK